MVKENAHQQIIPITQAFHESVALYVQHIIKLAAIAFIPAIASILLLTVLLLLLFSVAISSPFTQPENIAQKLFSLTNPAGYIALFLFLCMILIQVVGFIALVYTTVHHEQTTILGAFKHAFHFLWRFVLFGILLMCVIAMGLIVGYIIIIPIGALLRAISLDVLNSTFNWLILIPIIASAIASTFFIFSTFIIVENDVRVGESMRRSYALVKPFFWPVVVRVLLLYVVITTVAFLFQFVPRLGNILSMTLITPFSIVYLSILYKSIQKNTRKS
ncbi:MAG TPA: hypothetical protein VJB65_00970 [Patescibacteria group bacterium]|nr:hypothetical protein [Patescibacteria group bacterium]